MSYSFYPLPDGRILGRNSHGNKMFFSPTDILNRINGIGFSFRDALPEEVDMTMQAAKDLGYEWNDTKPDEISG